MYFFFLLRFTYWRAARLFLLQTQTEILNRENKITWLVITLLVLFLICHTPNVVYSLYNAWLSVRETSSDAKTTNFVLGEL